jgi:hypothetical protein
MLGERNMETLKKSSKDEEVVQYNTVGQFINLGLPVQATPMAIWNTPLEPEAVEAEAELDEPTSEHIEKALDAQAEVDLQASSEEEMEDQDLMYLRGAWLLQRSNFRCWKETRWKEWSNTEAEGEVNLAVAQDELREKIYNLLDTFAECAAAKGGHWRGWWAKLVDGQDDVEFNGQDDVEADQIVSDWIEQRNREENYYCPEQIAEATEAQADVEAYEDGLEADPVKIQEALEAQAEADAEATEEHIQDNGVRMGSLLPYATYDDYIEAAERANSCPLSEYSFREAKAGTASGFATYEDYVRWAAENNAKCKCGKCEKVAPISETFFHESKELASELRDRSSFEEIMMSIGITIGDSDAYMKWCKAKDVYQYDLETFQRWCELMEEPTDEQIRTEVDAVSAGEDQVTNEPTPDQIQEALEAQAEADAEETEDEEPCDERMILQEIARGRTEPTDLVTPTQARELLKIDNEKELHRALDLLTMIRRRAAAAGHQNRLVATRSAVPASPRI